MPMLTARMEDITVYMEAVEKDEIKPQNLPPCPSCYVKSANFKLHAYRERTFYILVEMIVTTVSCALLRFRCPGCRKTFTYYPDFAIPHKRYTRQSVVAFSGAYTENDRTTYEKAIEVEHAVPGYENDDRTLSPSTIHRWITTLSRYTETCRKALQLILQKDPLSSLHRDFAQLHVPRRKYRSESQKKALIACRNLIRIEAGFKAAFGRSVFTKLAMNCGYR